MCITCLMYLFSNSYISVVIRPTEFYPVPNRRIFYEESVGPYRSELAALVPEICPQAADLHLSTITMLYVVNARYSKRYSKMFAKP